MDNGGAVYMEGANVGQSHVGSDFFDHFGAEYINAGGQNSISTITGMEGSFASNSTFGYPTGDPNYGIDILEDGLGFSFLKSQDDYDRAVYYDAPGWRTICSAPILGCFNQDTQFSTRKFLMTQYLAFLSGLDAPLMELSAYELNFATNAPGEDVSETITIYNNGFFDLEIWDMQLAGDPVFMLDTPAPVTVPGREAVELTLTFRSDATGDFAGYMTITSNDIENPDEILFLNGSCIITDGDADEIPQNAASISVYPNPFNPQTSFHYQLDTPQNIRLDIYNIKGQLLETLVDESQSAGEYNISWQANSAASAIYLYKFTTGKQAQTGKLILLK